MTILAITTLNPIDASNGGTLRFWHLCDRGRYPCIFLEPHVKSLPSNLQTLKWKSLARQDESGVVEACLRHQKLNGTIFVQGLELALRLRELGMTADYVDIVDSYSVYFSRRFDYLRWRNPLKKINSLHQSWRHLLRERKCRSVPWTILTAAASDAKPFMGRKAKVIAAPNGSGWVDEPTLYVGRAKANILGFHGGMTWEPNISAAEYFARKVMPHVLQRNPNARFKIIGGPIVPRIEALRTLPGVELLGRVPDMRAALSEIDVYVMPMDQGSGVKTKLMEAMSAGLPVVTNRQGAEAFLPQIDGVIAVDDAPVSMAKTVCALLESQQARSKASHVGRQFAVENFRSKSLLDWAKAS
jgi:glycosyltransferase involved in cell wall biosynthesis